MQEEDEFRKSFKYYKSKESKYDMSKIGKFNDNNFNMAKLTSCILDQDLEQMRLSLGLKSPLQWNVFTHLKHPGLIIIQNPFFELGSLLWIRRCLINYPDLPHKTNLSKQDLVSLGNCWWNHVYKFLVRDEKNKLISKLRWATLGYHHNWDTKEYSDQEVSPMPKELQDLCRIVLNGVGISEFKSYRAEAAIVNYYPPGSTLSPHTDHSEPCKSAPLLSFSFGRSAIFLIGGHKKSIEPTALYLNHGDIMIMTKASRLCYHAVPRIIDENDIPLSMNPNHLSLSPFMEFKAVLMKLLEILNSHTKLADSSEKVCFNVLNIIQKWEAHLGKSNSDFLDFLEASNHSFIVESSSEEFNSEFTYDLTLLDAIYKYISSIRINVNVRQVNEINV